MSVTEGGKAGQAPTRQEAALAALVEDTRTRGTSYTAPRMPLYLWRGMSNWRRVRLVALYVGVLVMFVVSVLILTAQATVAESYRWALPVAAPLLVFSLYADYRDTRRRSRLVAAMAMAVLLAALSVAFYVVVP